jgi:hypothetical protein
MGSWMNEANYSLKSQINSRVVSTRDEERRKREGGEKNRREHMCVIMLSVYHH